MEKRSIFYEFAFKCSFFVISFILAIYSILNIINMVPLLKAYSISNDQLYYLFFNTDVGDIFTKMKVLEDSKLFVMIKEGFNAIITSLNWANLIFLFLFALLLFSLFIYPKWKLVKTYITLSSLIIAGFILRYISFGLCVLYYFNDSIIGLTNGFFFGAIFYLLFSIFMLFIMCLFMIKFIFNVYFDVKNIMALE